MTGSAQAHADTVCAKHFDRSGQPRQYCERKHRIVTTGPPCEGKTCVFSNVHGGMWLSSLGGTLGESHLRCVAARVRLESSREAGTCVATAVARPQAGSCSPSSGRPWRRQ